MAEQLTDEQIKAEDTARHEARLAVLKQITSVANHNNSSSAKAYAEAYASLCTEPNTKRPYERPAPTAMPGRSE